MGSLGAAIAVFPVGERENDLGGSLIDHRNSFHW